MPERKIVLLARIGTKVFLTLGGKPIIKDFKSQREADAFEAAVKNSQRYEEMKSGLWRE